MTGQDTGAEDLTGIVSTLLSLRTVQEPVVAVQVSAFLLRRRRNSTNTYIKDHASV